MKLGKKRTLLLVLVVTLLSACSSQNQPSRSKEETLDNFNATGMPIVNEEITLDFFVGKRTVTGIDMSEVKSLKAYKNMTNININWTQVGNDAMEEKRNLALASGEMPDVFYASAIPNLDLMKYGERGTFVKLNDLIDEYAPNLKGILDEHPDIRKAITSPDGGIYSLPYITSPESISLRSFPILYFHRDWLDALDMEIPETTDEFYQYLKAVKEGDPNGNGQADEVPYGGNNIDVLIGWLNGSFGIGNRGRPYIDMDPEENKLRFYSTSDRYKEMLEYIHKLYSEELINQNIFSIDGSQYYASAADGVYGSTVYYDPGQVFSGVAKESFISGLPLAGPHGDRSKTMSNPLRNVGVFVITNKNKHPEATVRWADYFYSDEGLKALFMGVEGESFEETSDGEFVLLETITSPPPGVTQDQALAEYAIYLNTGAPAGILKQDFFKGAETTPSSLEAVERMKPYLNEESWPVFTFTEEENRKLSSLSNDIEKYVDEMKAKFITGNVSFSQWDQYVQTIESMGLNEYMNIMQAAYERYENN